jgi:hypothetical protein
MERERCFQRLEGNVISDTIFKKELKKAGIKVEMIDYDFPNQLPIKCRGVLYNSKKEEVVCFRRNDDHIGISGDIPLSVVNELRQYPIGEADIRIMGDENIRNPEKFAYVKNEDLVKLQRFDEKPELYINFVTVYSQLALNLFVKTLKTKKLVRNSIF